MWFRFNDRLTQVDEFRITVEGDADGSLIYCLNAYKAGREMLVGCFHTKAGREMLVGCFHTKTDAYDALNYIETLINLCLNNSNQGYVIDLDFEDD